MGKHKISHEAQLELDMLFYIDKMKQDNSNTFWQPRMDELLPIYKKYLTQHPEELDDIIKSYAWHTFNYALKQR